MYMYYMLSDVHFPMVIEVHAESELCKLRTVVCFNLRMIDCGRSLRCDVDA